MTKAQAPSVASHRLEVTSLDDFLDTLMAHLPHASLPMDDEAKRAIFREWLRDHLKSFLRQVTWDAQKGAERGVAQVLALVDDPSYFETQTARRRKQRLRAKEQADQSRREWMEEMAEREANTRELIQSGKLLPVTGRWKMREVSPEKDDGA